MLIIGQGILYSFMAVMALILNLSDHKQENISEIKLRKLHYNVDKTGVAIQGYDPISYLLSRPKKGVAEFSYIYKGITYLFSSQKNMELFKRAPTKLEPEYGGWCAYAMGASGEKVEIDPKSFKITNGKLYLFYKSYFNNTIEKWNKDEVRLSAKGDANWKKLVMNENTK